MFRAIIEVKAVQFRDGRYRGIKLNLYETIVSKTLDLESLVAKLADEGRIPSDDEKARLCSLRNDIEEIKHQWESEGRSAFLASLNTKHEENRPMVLKADQKFADAVKGSYPAEFDRLSIGRLLRGYLAAEWAGAELEQKAMASSPTTAGGILIPAPLSARIIDIARNRAAVMRAGAVTIPMATATVKLARQTQDVTGGWYSEAAAIAASDAAFDSVTFTARKLAALVVVNNELLEDTEGLDAVIEQSIAAALALKLDLVSLVGSGSAPEPRGIQNTSNIKTVTGVGTPASWDKFIEAIYKLRQVNYDPNAVIYSARTAESLAKLKTGLASDNTPLQMPADIAALMKLTSNQVPNNLGSGTDESLAFVGQWNQLAIGMRRNITVEVAREGAYDVSGTVYSAFQKDQTLIRATLRADVQVLQPAAFCLMSGITVG